MKKIIFAMLIIAISYFVLGTNNAQAYSTFSDLTDPTQDLNKAASTICKTSKPLCTTGICTSGTIEAADVTNESSLVRIAEPPSPPVASISASPMPVSSDTPTPTPAMSPTVDQTQNVQPTSTVASNSPIDSPTPIPASPTPIPDGTLPLNADVIFSLINQTRSQSGLTPFQKDDRICSIAQSRAPELYDEILVNHNMHAGFYARNIPYWATENIIYMRTEQEAVNWWLNSPIHRAAIYGNYQYSCVACSGNTCSEIFTNFQPKVQQVTQAVSSTQITPSPLVPSIK